jgi:hypothetical protein
MDQNRYNAPDDHQCSRPDYQALSGLTEARESVMLLALSALRNQGLAGLVIVATFIAVAYVAGKLVGVGELSSFGLVGGLLSELLIALVGAMFLKLARQVDAENPEARSQPPPEPPDDKGGQGPPDGPP